MVTILILLLYIPEISGHEYCCSVIPMDIPVIQIQVFSCDIQSERGTVPNTSPSTNTLVISLPAWASCTSCIK
jgi:hypothetical protein